MKGETPMHKMDAPLAKATRSLRERFGFEQIELADRLGITNVHLCNLEAGRSTYSVHVVRRLSDIYGIDVYLYTAVTFVPLNWYALPLRENIRTMRMLMDRELAKALGEKRWPESP
jgi:transcriptional regulator with XRE-family HTH domain